MTKTPYERARELADHWKPVANVALDLQDDPATDAAHFLRTVLEDLAEARSEIAELDKSKAQYDALRYTIYASNLVRYALNLLEQEKEETCKKSSRG